MMKCNEIQESLRAGTGGAFRSHLEKCPECSGVAAREALLSSLIKLAPEAKAPEDFAGAVMQKIENRKEAGSGLSLFGPKFLIPVSAAAVLVMIIVAFFAIVPRGSDPGVAEIAPENPVNENSSNGPAPIPAETTSELPEPDELADTAEPQRVTSGDRKAPLPVTPRVPGAGREDEQFNGGSRDLAADPGERNVPDWVGTPRELQEPVPARKFSPKEILGEFGINAKFESRGWKVISVRPGSIGARSGVVRGDLIKALDGQLLGETPLEGGGRSLLVVRAGKEIELAIKP